MRLEEKLTQIAARQTLEVKNIYSIALWGFGVK